MTVKKGDRSPLILRCGSGCDWRHVLAALDLTPAEVFGDSAASVVDRREYLYSNKHGAAVFRVLRLLMSDGTKTFRQHEALPNGEWGQGLGNAKRVLYNLPGLRKAIKDGFTIHLTEGEKDADALNAFFRENGLSEFATCHSGGGGKWDVDDSAKRYLKNLQGAVKVVNWSDRDSKGYSDALDRHESVSGAGLEAEIRLPVPTAPKADVYDHLKSGHKPDDGIRVSAEGLSSLVGESKDEAHQSAVAKELGRLRARRDAEEIFRNEATAARLGKSAKARRLGGGEFFVDAPDAVPVLWGEGNEILWADGEPTMIVGDDGTGKSTIDHQLIAARLGLRDEVLGYSVEPAEGVIVYLAMDRPDQARRAGHRLFSELGAERGYADRHLAVWTGPLPLNPLSSPEVLADWLQSEFGQVADVHADSLKDLATNISDDGPGSRLNLAIQEVVARGINWIGLHHQRKANGENRNPDSLADVYGSRWLTAGHGSILMLTKGKDDKDYIELKQLKEPADRIPRLMLRHDRLTGLTHRVAADLDFESALLVIGKPATVNELLRLMYPGQEPSDTLRKRVKRQADGKVKAGEVLKIAGTTGGSGGSSGDRYELTPEDDS